MMIDALTPHAPALICISLLTPCSFQGIRIFMHYYRIQLMNEYVEASPLFQNIAKLRLNDNVTIFFLWKM